jgi:hypothetical protein
LYVAIDPFSLIGVSTMTQKEMVQVASQVAAAAREWCKRQKCDWKNLGTQNQLDALSELDVFRELPGGIQMKIAKRLIESDSLSVAPPKPCPMPLKEAYVKVLGMARQCLEDYKRHSGIEDHIASERSQEKKLMQVIFPWIMQGICFDQGKPGQEAGTSLWGYKHFRLPVYEPFLTVTQFNRMRPELKKALIIKRHATV